MLDGGNRTGADYDIGLFAKYRRGQRRNVIRIVLIVGVGIDDDVRFQMQAGFQASHEGARQALVAGMANHVVDAIFAGDADCVVAAAVINDQPFDAIKSSDISW